LFYRTGFYPTTGEFLFLNFDIINIAFAKYVQITGFPSCCLIYGVLLGYLSQSLQASNRFFSVKFHDITPTPCTCLSHPGFLASLKLRNYDNFQSKEIDYQGVSEIII